MTPDTPARRGLLRTALIAAPLLLLSTPAWAGVEEWLQTISNLLSEKAIDTAALVGRALGLLLIGWLLSKIASLATFRLLQKTTLDDKLVEKLGIDLLLEGEDADEDAVERFFAAVVYYSLMLLVVLGVLDTLGMSQAAAPIQSMMTSVTGALPLIGKAGLILAAAYFGGLILKTLITRVLNRLGVDRRFAELSAAEGEQVEDAKPFSENVGQVVFWLLMFIGLAGASDALNITPISEPLGNALDEVFGLLPALGVAAALVIGGYVLGRIARAVLQNLLTAAGFNKLMARIKLDGLFGDTTPAGAVGWVAMAFILLQATIAALNELGLETLSAPLTEMMSEFWGLLPDLGVAALLGVLGLSVSRIVRGLVQNALKNLGFDSLLERLGLGRFAHHTEQLDEPSEILGLAAQVAVILMATAQILSHLGLSTWSGYVNGLLSYAVQNVAVSAGVIIVGFAVANYVRGLIANQLSGGAETPDAASRWGGEMARAVVLVFAFTAAIRHLDIAEDFVLISFALLFGSLCLAAALAFGLGARDVAGEIVRRQYDRAQHLRDEPASTDDGGDDATEETSG